MHLNNNEAIKIKGGNMNLRGKVHGKELDEEKEEERWYDHILI